MQEIFKTQTNAINRAKQYIFESSQKNIDIALSSLCFLTTWTRTVGHYKMLKLSGIKNFKYITFFIRDIFSISKHHDLEIYEPDQPKKNNTLIVSYCSKNNFDTEGNFHDNYFAYNSKNLNYSWLLISLDDFMPKSLKENIFIFRKKTNKRYNLIYLIKTIFKILFDQKISIKNIFHYITSQYIYADILMRKINITFKNLNINKLLINYEGIPFQHGIIKSINNLNKNPKTICYLHCASWPLQTDLIYREKLIDTLLVSGEDQKKNLISYLNWPKEKVSVIPSLRFNKKKESEFGGYLFVPFEIFYIKELLFRFEKFLDNLQAAALGKISIRIHPLNKNSSKHIKLTEELNKLLAKHENKFNKKKNQDSIMLGYATGVCVQALEEGTTIYHFPYNDIIDVFSERIWNNIKVEKIDNLVFKYSLKNKNKMFFVNYENEKFNKYINPLLQ